ncbi:MAG: YbgC/FadM family acyl-CoA thioesterase [Pseudomonadota bacterium]
MDNNSVEFSLPIRVYIEDTDAGGIVYYVNYLKYLERARTEFMRSHGWDKDSIFNQGLMFVVHDLSMRYLAPARLDDWIGATARVCKVGGATMVLEQRVYRCSDEMYGENFPDGAPLRSDGGELLADGLVTIAAVNPETLAPRRMPKEMLAKLRALSPSTP